MQEGMATSFTSTSHESLISLHHSGTSILYEDTRAYTFLGTRDINISADLVSIDAFSFCHSYRAFYFYYFTCRKVQEPSCRLYSEVRYSVRISQVHLLPNRLSLLGPRLRRRASLPPHEIHRQCFYVYSVRCNCT